MFAWDALLWRKFVHERGRIEGSLNTAMDKIKLFIFLLAGLCLTLLIRS